jgi:two-component system chemotaxis response regulator CheB
MPVPRVVVIGGSSGAIEALTAVVSHLPPDLPAPICAVIHIGSDSPGVIPLLLARAGRLPAVLATDGAKLRNGHIYIAPSDHHLVIEPSGLLLTKGPKENGFRPAIDPLFRSAAQVYGPTAIGVVLSGALDDGTAGLRAIKRLGGVALVQDPAEALFKSMPSSAITHAAIDHVAPAAELGTLINRLVRTPHHELQPVPVPPSLEAEIEIAKERRPRGAGAEDLGMPSTLTCPDCNGVLFRIEDGTLVRFRCHTGHGYSANSVVAALDQAIEATLWQAIRGLQEGELLMRTLATEAIDCERDAAALLARADAARRDADAVRRLATARRSLTEDDEGTVPESAVRPAGAPD